jgi:hypothetical protein
MARPVSLGTLRADARLRADMPSAGFCSDAEVNRYINQGYTELYDWLIASGEEYFMSSTTINTTSGTDTYALPNDFFEIRGVDVNIGAQQVLTAHRFTFEERNRYKLIVTGWFFNEPCWYQLRGTNIVFMPAPQGVYIVTVWYYPIPVAMVSDSDTIDGVNGWDEIIVLDAAIKMLQREESFDAADRLKADKAAIKDRILRRIAARDAGSPARVSDVRGSNNARSIWRRT